MKEKRQWMWVNAVWSEDVCRDEFDKAKENQEFTPLRQKMAKIQTLIDGSTVELRERYNSLMTLFSHNEDGKRIKCPECDCLIPEKKLKHTEGNRLAIACRQMPERRVDYIEYNVKYLDVLCPVCEHSLAGKIPRLKTVYKEIVSLTQTIMNSAIKIAELKDEIKEMEHQLWNSLVVQYTNIVEPSWIIYMSLPFGEARFE